MKIKLNMIETQILHTIFTFKVIAIMNTLQYKIKDLASIALMTIDVSMS